MRVIIAQRIWLGNFKRLLKMLLTVIVELALITCKKQSVIDNWNQLLCLIIITQQYIRMNNKYQVINSMPVDGMNFRIVT